MCKVYSAEQILGSILCKDSTKKLDLNSLYVLESKVRKYEPNVIFSMREYDIEEAVDSYPNIFCLRDGYVSLSEQEYSSKLADLYFSSLVDAKIVHYIKEVLENDEAKDYTR